MIDVQLNTVPGEIPHPPPWRVKYITDREHFPSYGGVLPVARTEGISKYGLPELEIRLAPPQLAAALLDRVGILHVFEGKRVNVGQQLRVNTHPVVVYTVTPVVTEDGQPIYRLAWERDPAPDSKELLIAIDKFNKTFNRFLS